MRRVDQFNSHTQKGINISTQHSIKNIFKKVLWNCEKELDNIIICTHRGSRKEIFCICEQLRWKMLWDKKRTVKKNIIKATYYNFDDLKT
jgi:hypothetical protein